MQTLTVSLRRCIGQNARIDRSMLNDSCILLQVYREMAPIISSPHEVMLSLMLASLLWCGLSAAIDECPAECLCNEEEGSANCAFADVFPTGLPATTKTIAITHSHFDEIPSEALGKYSNFTSLTLMHTSIGVIRQHAFYRIGQGIPGKQMVFLNVSMAHIESGAFEELEDFEVISIFLSTMTNVSSGAFSKIHNIQAITIHTCDIPILPTATFIDLSHVGGFYMASTKFDTIEHEAFSNVTDMGLFNLAACRVGVLGSRFLTSTDIGQVDISTNTFGLWEECALCGINAQTVTISSNVVNGSDGNHFSGMSSVSSLVVLNNFLHSITPRLFPYDLESFEFAGNDVTTFVCEELDADYPSNVTYVFAGNRVTCDCRLNWMWMMWSQTTRAAQAITPGFTCSGPEGDNRSLLKFFNLSLSGDAPPCDGLEPVNDCSGTASPSTASLDVSSPDSASTTHIPTTTTDTNASPVSARVGWLAIAVVLLTLNIG